MAFDVGSAVGYLMLDTSKFTSGFNQARQSLKTFQDETATAADKFTSVGQALSLAGGTLTKSVTIPLVGVGAAAVSTAATFEGAMSQVQATMGITKDDMSEVNGETVNTMDALKALALELGSTTKFTATEAAQALNYMALAGYDAETSIGMLPTVLSLAAAGGMDLARASDMVTDAQTALGLSLDETSIMVDQMARAASRSNTSVAQLGDAILTIGGTARYMAGGTEEIATTLGVLADNGIKASEAGTHLRNIILKLASPTKDGVAVMEELGLSVFDAEGKMRSFEDIFGDLNKAMADYTDEQKITAFSDLFNARDIASATALLGTTSERWNELRDSIIDAEGAAGQMADTQLDNLQGQLVILKSGIEGAAIAFGDLLLPLIKDVIGVIQSAVDWVNSLDDRQKRMIVTIAEVVASVGPMLLIFGKLSSTIGKVITIISGAGGLSGVLTILTGPIGIIIAAVAALATAWVTNFGGIRDKTQEILEHIQSVIDFFLGIITAIWESKLLGLQEIFAGVWDTISKLFEDVLNVITDVFAIFGNLFSGNWEGLWNSVGKLFQDVWKGITDFLSGALDFIIKLIFNIGISIFNVAYEAFMFIKRGVEKAWANFVEWFEKAKEDPIGMILSIGSSLFEAGKSIINSLWNGIKSIWSDLIGWFTEKINWIKDKVMFWQKSKEEMNSSSVSDEGDFGLNYTGSNSRNFGGTRSDYSTPTQPQSGGDTYNFYSPEALTPTKAAAAMKQAKMEMAMGLY